ncbi:MAG: PilZ domain-containing protein [Planctomycetota bacterium]
MRLWFHRMAGLLGLDETCEHRVVDILRRAAVRSASIGIGTVDGVALPNPFSGHVVELEPEALVISRPLEGPNRRELLAGERLHLSVASERGFHHGDVEVLGRWSTGEGASKRYGYRVSIPQALVHEERRMVHRVPVAFDLAPVAHLSRPASLAPVGSGVVVDLSEGGMCVRAELRNLVVPGEAIIVRASFPAVIPEIHTRMEIAHAVPSRAAGQHDLGLRFLEPQPELAQAIRALEIRRVNRAGAA